jgi:hypothetical protein
VLAFDVSVGRITPKEVDIPKFMVAVVAFAYLRSNPSMRSLYEATSASDAKATTKPRGSFTQQAAVAVPDALEAMLDELVLPNCKRDDSLTERSEYEADDQLHAVFPLLKPILEGLFVTAAGGKGGAVSLSKFFSLFTTGEAARSFRSDCACERVWIFGNTMVVGLGTCVCATSRPFGVFRRPLQIGSCCAQ